MTNRYTLPRQLAGQTHRPPPVRLYTPPTESDRPLKPPPLTIWPDAPVSEPSAPKTPAEKPDMPDAPFVPSATETTPTLFDDPDRVFLWLLILLLIRNNASLELVLALCYIAM